MGPEHNYLQSQSIGQPLNCRKHGLMMLSTGRCKFFCMKILVPVPKGCQPLQKQQWKLTGSAA